MARTTCVLLKLFSDTFIENSAAEPAIVHSYNIDQSDILLNKAEEILRALNVPYVADRSSRSLTIEQVWDKVKTGRQYKIYFKSKSDTLLGFTSRTKIYSDMDRYPLVRSILEKD